MQPPIKILTQPVVLVLLALSLMHAAPLLAQDDPVVEVESAWPSAALQGTYDLTVDISGSNFGRGAIVRFLANCDGVPDTDPKPSYCDDDAPGVVVGPAKAKGTTRLTVTVDIAEDAYVGDIDILVELYDGRKGKGTTMFRVEKATGKPTEGNGSDSGDDIKLSCVFDDANGENVISDGRSCDPDTGVCPYDDGVLNVSCSTGGTSQPNLSGIGLQTNASAQLERELDLALERCEKSVDDRCMTQPEIDKLTADLPEHMNGIFSEGSGGNVFDMENVAFSVRPYWDAEIPERWSGLTPPADGYHHGGDHLQKLSPGPYRMALRIWLKRPERGDPRVMINLAGHDVPGDQFQGVSCDPVPDPDQNPYPPGIALTEDVRVTVATPTEAPLLYTVDTGGGYMLASICSNMPRGRCGKGNKVNELCTFHGLVKVKMNFMAFELP